MSHKYALGVDVHSWAIFHDVVSTHIDLSLRVDFTRKIFHGYVEHTLAILKDDVPSALFDAKALAIEDVETVTGQALTFTIPRSHPIGVQLKVDLPQPTKKGDVVKVRIHYSTTPKAGGLQWFEPEQTTGKKHPYVYTQCQAILARTLLPCMDTPAVKCPYSVKVTVPSPLIAVASGTPAKSNPTFEEDGWLTYQFEQKLPIPSYLIAIACGALKSHTIGPRSSVWTEKELLQASVHEFSAHTEEFIAAAEGLFKGLPYEWGTYDLLVLPTAFPYGGMENPQLTFVNASLLAGDRSLVDVIAHEICHSWSGNLVTNDSWKDFWINEGFTMYLERLLLAKVIGGEDYRLFHIYLGYKELVKTMKDLLAAGETEFTKLRPDETGIDPDDAFSLVPYEKGCLFLFFLEVKVGGRDNLTQWIGQFYLDHKAKSIGFDTLKQHFLAYFADKVSKDVLAQINWDHWMEHPGMPDFDPSSHLSNKYSKQCESLTHKWFHTTDGSDLSPQDIAEFKPSQVMYCLDEAVGKEGALPFKHAVLAKMEEQYKFFSNKNPEISNRFIGLCLRSGYTESVPVAAKFLAAHGRGKYVKYLYNCLNNHNHTAAVQVYKDNRHRYHSVIRNAFDSKLAQ